jgi:hypothetical protein
LKLEKLAMRVIARAVSPSPFPKGRRLLILASVCVLGLVSCGLYSLQCYGRNCGPVSWDDVTGYDTRTVLSLLSKDVVVRSVYFDDRPRSGHVNASVFMVEARREIVDQGLIVGCQVGRDVAEFFQVRRLALIEVYVHWKHNYVNHDLVMVDCFDLPRARNGSRAFIFVKKANRGGHGGHKVYSVESERPMFFPAPRISRGNDIKLLVCVATARYTSYNRRLTVYSMIYHWLKYQRTIGVDHVHFIAHPSFVERGTLQNDVIRRDIQDGFLSIEFWEPWLNTTDNYHGHSQMLAYEDCVYKHRGTYDYIMMCDTDDFFMPRVPGQPQFQYYIRNWCHYGACRFHWIERYPDCGLDSDNISPDGNITKMLRSGTERRLSDNKSLYKSSVVLDVGIHMPMESISGYSVIHVPSNVAYFAHVRHDHNPRIGGATC